MAHVYIDSNAGGSGTGADWTNAYTTVAAALTGSAVAGNNFWVAQDHAETQASAMTMTSPGTNASPCTLICVNKAGTVPPVAADLATTATVTTTGANAMNIAGGSTYVYGIIFSAASGANNGDLNISTNTGRFVFKNCTLGNASTNNRLIVLGGATGASYIELDNTKLSFGAVGHVVQARGRLVWKNTASAIAGSVPTNLFSTGSGRGNILVEGVDLSAAGSGKNLVAASVIGPVIFKDCKLGASVTPAATGTSPDLAELTLIRCDSGDTNYRTEKYSYMGVQSTETTIVLTDGASDGTTPIAWKIVTTANAEWIAPFECIPITIWNETTTEITVTLQGIWGDGSVPNNDNIWMDVEYLGTSGFPIGSFATSNKASYLATAAALSAGSGTWGGSTTKFKLTATFTPAEKGPITIYVKVGLASKTFYIDPKPVIS